MTAGWLPVGWQSPQTCSFSCAEGRALSSQVQPRVNGGLYTAFCKRPCLFQLLCQGDWLEQASPKLVPKTTIYCIYRGLWQVCLYHMSLPAMRETWVRSLGREDPLEKGMSTHSSILPGGSHRQRSLVDYGPQGCKELNTTEWLLLIIWKVDREFFPKFHS